jgi:hypothetical protein
VPHCGKALQNDPSPTASNAPVVALMGIPVGTPFLAGAASVESMIRKAIGLPGRAHRGAGSSEPRRRFGTCDFLPRSGFRWGEKVWRGDEQCPRRTAFCVGSARLVHPGSVAVVPTRFPRTVETKTARCPTTAQSLAYRRIRRSPPGVRSSGVAAGRSAGMSGPDVPPLPGRVPGGDTVINGHLVALAGDVPGRDHGDRLEPHFGAVPTGSPPPGGPPPARTRAGRSGAGRATSSAVSVLVIPDPQAGVCLPLSAVGVDRLVADAEIGVERCDAPAGPHELRDSGPELGWIPRKRVKTTGGQRRVNSRLSPQPLSARTWAESCCRPWRTGFAGA